jgi:hypothetical protein
MNPHLVASDTSLPPPQSDSFQKGIVKTLEPALLAQQPNAFQEAINRAESAGLFAQSSQSKEDWEFVANLWREAIELLRSLPASSPKYKIAQEKIKEYQRNQAYAQQQARRFSGQNSSAPSAPRANPQRQPAPVVSKPSAPRANPSASVRTGSFNTTRSS